MRGMEKEWERGQERKGRGRTGKEEQGEKRGKGKKGKRKSVGRFGIDLQVEVS